MAAGPVAGAGLSVGRRAGRLRESFGLSRAEVAEAVGRNPEWLRAVEAGRQRIDRQAMLNALAEVLGVSPGELLGVPCGREDAVTGAAHRALPALRRAVLRTGLPAAEEAADESLGRLHGRLVAAAGLRRDGRWAELALGLPALLDGLHAATVRAWDRDSAEPARMLAEVLHETALLTKRLGAYDLAALAAAEARRSAAASGDPASVAAAGWLQAEVALCMGAPDEAAGFLEAGLVSADGPRGRGDRYAWAVWGTLHLVSAVLEGQRGRQAESSGHLAEAAAAVAHTDASAAGATGFGVGEWAVHTVHAALELGEDLGALERIDGVDLRGLPAERRARHGVDRARALARAGDAAGMAGELLAADRVAAQVVRTHPLVGELLRTASGRPVAGVAEAAAVLGVQL